MADDHPQMSGGSAPAARDERSLQKPAESTDNVEMRILSDKQKTDGDKAPAIPPKDLGSDPSDEITEAKRSPKGKEKAEIPPAPIEKIDPLAIASVDASTASGPPEGPICNITLLLPSGARHPYRIDEKYLTKRSVEVPDLTEDGKKDPFSISIYKLKELILREWREDWEAKPASPTSIRLIHFGKLLEDKEMLKKYQFSRESPNVVHMSVRPPEMMEDEDQNKGKSQSREGRAREGGGGCCVIL